jgi:RNA polymerase sigma factor (sigma-70 family)
MPRPIPPSASDPRIRRFQVLWFSQYDWVWSLVKRLGVPAADTEDVVQQVFLAAYKSLDSLSYQVSERTWLFSISRSKASHHRRGLSRHARKHAAISELARIRPEIARPQQQHDDLQQLEFLLRELAPGLRDAWEKHSLLGMTGPEIASVLNIPINTVNSRIRLAREKLEKLVSDPAQLEAWCEAARRPPPPGKKQRAWALMLPTLNKPGLLGLFTACPAPVGVAATLIVAVALGSVAPRAPSRSTIGPAVLLGAEAEVDGDGPQDEPPPPPALAAASAAAEPAVLTSKKKVRRAVPAGTTEDQARLAEEIALINQAQGQLAAGEADAALATVARHAERFFAGTLADVREVARIDALCRRGDLQSAEAAAQRLLREHPTSAAAQRFAVFRCADERTTFDGEDAG